MKNKDSLPEFVIKQDGAYMALGTKGLKYLDLTNYLAAGTSLVKLYAAHKVKFSKAPHPYEFLDSLEKLKGPSLSNRSPESQKALDDNNEELMGKLAKEDPCSSVLSQKIVSNEEVDLCEKEWKLQNVQNLGDFVKYYDDLDVIGLVKGIEKMSKIYHDQGLTIFKKAVNLLALTQNLIFCPLKEDYLTMFSKAQDYIYK